MRITAINTNNKGTTSQFSVKKYANIQSFKSGEIPKHVLEDGFRRSSHKIDAVKNSIIAITKENYKSLVRDAKFFGIAVGAEDNITTLEQKLAPQLALKDKIGVIFNKFNGSTLVKFESGTYHQDEIECALKNCGKTDWEGDAIYAFQEAISSKKHDESKTQTFNNWFVNFVERTSKNPDNNHWVKKRKLDWKAEATQKVKNVQKFIDEELTPEKGFTDKEAVSKMYEYLTNSEIIIEPNSSLSAITK